jgi:hypothetical protein
MNSQIPAATDTARPEAQQPKEKSRGSTSDRQTRAQEEQRRREREELKRQERERLEKEQQEREREAQNERVRQMAQKREERQRQAREQAEKEKKEWDQAWKSFVTRWVAFKGKPSNPLPSVLLLTFLYCRSQVHLRKFTPSKMKSC